MSQTKRLETGVLSVLVAVGVLVAVVNADPPPIRYSYTATTTPGKAFWIPVERFVARSANYGETANFVEDLAADTPPLTGKAFYFPITAGMAADTWTIATQADVWVEYQIAPSDLPPDFEASMTGTWYFHSRCQIPNVGSEDEMNRDSNWLIVNGQPPLAQGSDDNGDIDITDHTPTDAEWFTAVTAGAVNAPQRRYDRSHNDVQKPHGGVNGKRPNWTWVGSIDSQHIQKSMKLIDGKFTFRVYEAEAGDWNARIDVICWTNDPNFWPVDSDFLNAKIPGQCDRQHDVADFTPIENDNGAAQTTISMTGTNLDLVTQARLVRDGGGADIVGTNLVLGAGNTTLTADFATQGAQWGSYKLRTIQDPPCDSKTLGSPSFQLTCATETVFSEIQPSVVSNPESSIQFRVKGANVGLLTGARLVYANEDDPENPEIDATGLTPDGDDLLVYFDLSCANPSNLNGAPAGPYHLEGTRDSSCSNPQRLANALWVVKPPIGSPCAWQPWAASWSNLNKGDDQSPPNLVYNPTNWDYSFSQQTVMATAMDVPPGGGNKAFHFFWDNQPPDAQSQKAGSGGIYQEIQVTPGVPIEYSYWWKGAATAGDNIWFELLLLDGPFNLYYADGYQEQTRTQNNPYMVRKTTLGTSGGSFDWTEITDQTAADPGPYGPRPQTITPVNNVVTVVLKCGRYPQGGLEMFLDNVAVRQNGGANLISNGEFEAGTQVLPCDNEWMFQDPCESDFWRRSSLSPVLCPDPFADDDGDADVDQADFAAFQSCYTGSAWPLIDNACRCFDVNNDNFIDQVDLFKFEACASGPGLAADPACDDTP